MYVCRRPMRNLYLGQWRPNTSPNNLSSPVWWSTPPLNSWCGMITFILVSIFRGHVCLIVNVASQWGMTPKNYKQLQELHTKYAESAGLRILGFPCNQFGNQVRTCHVLSHLLHQCTTFMVLLNYNHAFLHSVLYSFWSSLSCWM